MPARTGEEMAVTLLRALPADVAETVLGRLDPVTAERLRAAPPSAPAPSDLDDALSEFFDLLRIADRARPTPEASAGEYRPVAGGGPKPAKWAPPEEPPPPNPIDALRELPAEKLLKVLQGEPASAVALVLSVLEPAAAGGVLKGLPSDVRAQVAVRFSQPGARNYPLIQQLAAAIVDKGKRLSEQPTEPPPDARIADLAAMLRALPRAERVSLFQTLGQSDAQLAERVREKLFRFADVAKIDDRALQNMMQQLNLKTIAVALKGAEEAIAAKITANISGRARELLQEEISLLGAVSNAQIEDARKEILALVRKAEEEGSITIEG